MGHKTECGPRQPLRCPGSGTFPWRLPKTDAFRPLPSYHWSFCVRQPTFTGTLLERRAPQKQMPVILRDVALLGLYS
ncbi:unnamed protein product [Heligmosomoides polygyrus]|uniref:Uncharacterized protein n=1 Tax=Heligmosomoides polygyrus TaxID=6339 RepID=A0A183FBM8_HELPZ|nr:unnamed protein product [Heligmosomoides polygyrus]